MSEKFFERRMFNLQPQFLCFFRICQGRADVGLQFVSLVYCMFAFVLSEESTLCILFFQLNPLQVFTKIRTFWAVRLFLAFRILHLHYIKNSIDTNLDCSSLKILSVCVNFHFFSWLSTSEHTIHKIYLERVFVKLESDGQSCAPQGLHKQNTSKERYNISFALYYTVNKRTDSQVAMAVSRACESGTKSPRFERRTLPSL